MDIHVLLFLSPSDEENNSKYGIIIYGLTSKKSTMTGSLSYEDTKTKYLFLLHKLFSTLSVDSSNRIFRSIIIYSEYSFLHDLWKEITIADNSNKILSTESTYNKLLASCLFFVKKYMAVIKVITITEDEYFDSFRKEIVKYLEL